MTTDGSGSHGSTPSNSLWADGDAPTNSLLPSPTGSPRAPQLRLSISMSRLVTGMVGGLCGAVVGQGVGSPDVVFKLLKSSRSRYIAYSSCLYAAATLSAAFAGVLSTWLGRRHVIHMTALLGIIGAAVDFFWDNEFPLVMFGRFVTGMAMGLASVVGPLYVSELTTVQDRGRVGYSFAVGLLSSFILISFLDWQADWIGETLSVHLVVLSPFIPCLLLLAASNQIRESPYWRRRRYPSLNNRSYDYPGESSPTSPLSPPSEATEVPIVTTMNLLALAVAFQLTGFLAAQSWARGFFKRVDLIEYTLAILLLDCFDLCACIGGMFVVSRLDRKSLVCGSLLGLCVGNILLAIGTGMERDGVLLFGLMLVCGSCSIGVGSLFFVLVTEIFPFESREKLCGFAVASAYLVGVLVAIVFPRLKKKYSQEIGFAFFAISAFLSSLVLFSTAPETRLAVFPAPRGSVRSPRRANTAHSVPQPRQKTPNSFDTESPGPSDADSSPPRAIDLRVHTAPPSLYSTI
eukprot:NODE_1445_length_1733_cov_85.738509_g1371_i0.p1 GENE.NODE_1445_length_1733_cov_85.738509_g1371_i0~~NODE_1445_length_1733_cov_85.738509_g1371_i0.p1  ORF type:complete len:518 (+),score=9.64 NODE_1445_length_1733_cov_85.738509_g1371_i0:64-1617(+)